MVYVATLFVSASLLVAGVATLSWWRMIRMPGKRLRSMPPRLEASQQPLCEALERDLRELSVEIGERNISRRPEQLGQTVAFLERELRDAGFQTQRQEFEAAGMTVCNVIAERLGERLPQEIVVVGAHYDTVPGSPGANDNGSAVVANLALARHFAARSAGRTLRFVFFPNEEAPYYMTDAMGSLRYARLCRERGENVIGMLALETIGCYFDEPNTQHYPVKTLGYLYPTTGNFLAIVGNVRSRRFVHQVVRGFRRASFPAEGIAAPSWLKDAFRSDHAAFWHCGYPALMVTDTANFRYEHYHTVEDSFDKINFKALTHVVTGLAESLAEVADG